MAVKHGFWVECDKCGRTVTVDAAGASVPAPFGTEAEALRDAVDRHDFSEVGERHLCPECFQAGGAEPLSWEEQVEAAVRAVLPTRAADKVVGAGTYGTLCGRLAKYCERTGRTAREALNQLDEDSRMMAGDAFDPTGFMIMKVAELK